MIIWRSRYSMGKPLDTSELLRRGGEMSPDEVKQLAQELTEAKLAELSAGTSHRSFDQPVKVVPVGKHALTLANGYFTQQKFLWGRTPEQMESILGVFGKLRLGAHILQFQAPLKEGDFENRAYSYLPDGKEYVPDPNEKVYLPGDGAPQWRLTKDVQARCIATLQPGQAFNKLSLR
jgi:hypothetical protein